MPVKKFPKCEALGARRSGRYKNYWHFPPSIKSFTTAEMEVIELALSRAENKTPHKYNSASYNKGFEQGKLAKAFLAKKTLEKNLTEQKENYLAFIQEQMHYRKSPEEGKIGKDERSTTEYLMLNMCWQEFVKEFYGQYPALDMKKNRELWIKIDERLKSQLSEKKEAKK
jgi:hypothetical protein